MVAESLLVLGVFSVSFISLSWSAPASVLPTYGECSTNGTHYYNGQYVTELPACWVAICHDETSKVTVATPCTAGPDRHYTPEEYGDLIQRHCYPSGRGELPGNQCCGGYLICAHDEESNKDHFNISVYLEVMFKYLHHNVMRNEPEYYQLDQAK